MTTARSFHAATSLSDGRVLVTGGIKGGDTGPFIEKSAEIYDPNTGVWRIADQMANARYGHTATALSLGRVLITGGAGPGGDCASTVTAEIYDSAAWRPARPMAIARGFQTGTLLLNGKILITGGNTLPASCAAITPTAQLYDANTGTWSSTGSMATGRSGQTATLLPDGRVVAAGGRSFDGSIYGSVATVEVYSPATGVWSSTGNMSLPRAYHTATLLPDGRVLVCGGHSLGSFNSNQFQSTEIYTP